MSRETVLREIADRLLTREPGHPLRVGLDGVCGSGKSTMARELAAQLASSGRPVIHVDSDGFHHERAVRYRQGRESARGYYDDAYDLDSVRDLVLVPLGPGGSRRFATKVHDMATDVVASEWQTAPENAIVLFDCTFIQRDDLRDHWDEVVYLDVPIERAQQRGVARDAAALGGVDAAQAAYESRYMAACRIYLDEQSPRERASIVIDNADPAQPRVLEQVLTGGNMTPVVRRGDSVHRASGPWTPTIHRLLSHLHDRGVDWAPQPQGLDAQGREVLSFVPGEVPAYPLPDWVFSDHVLEQAARMLRQLHDASIDFDTTAAIWQVPDHTPPEVICHNDFAPHNLVFVDGHVVGAIDFDTASPGPRLWDLAYLATRAVPLSRLEGERVAERTQLLLDAYGSDASVDDLIAVAIERLHDLAEYSDAKGVQLAKPELHAHAEHYRLEAAYLTAMR